MEPSPQRGASKVSLGKGTKLDLSKVVSKVGSFRTTKSLTNLQTTSPTTQRKERKLSVTIGKALNVLPSKIKGLPNVASQMSSSTNSEMPFCCSEQEDENIQKKLKAELRGTKIIIAAYEQQIEDLELENIEYKEKLASFIKEKDVKNYLQLRSQLEAIQNQKKAVEILIEEYKKQIKEYMQKMTAKDNEHKALVEAVNLRIVKAASEMQLLTDENASIKQLNDKLRRNSYDELEKITKLEGKLNERNNEAFVLNIELEKLKNCKTALESQAAKLSETELEAKYLNAKIETLSTKLFHLEKEKDNFLKLEAKNAKDVENINELQNKINCLKKKLKEKEKTEKEAKANAEKMQQLEQEQLELSNKLETIERSKRQLENANEELERQAIRFRADMMQQEVQLNDANNLVEQTVAQLNVEQQICAQQKQDIEKYNTHNSNLIEELTLLRTQKRQLEEQLKAKPKETSSVTDEGYEQEKHEIFALAQTNCDIKTEMERLQNKRQELDVRIKEQTATLSELTNNKSSSCSPNSIKDSEMEIMRFESSAQQNNTFLESCKQQDQLLRKALDELEPEKAKTLALTTEKEELENTAQELKLQNSSMQITLQLKDAQAIIQQEERHAYKEKLQCLQANMQYKLSCAHNYCKALIEEQNRMRQESLNKLDELAAMQMRCVELQSLLDAAENELEKLKEQNDKQNADAMILSEENQFLLAQQKQQKDYLVNMTLKCQEKDSNLHKLEEQTNALTVRLQDLTEQCAEIKDKQQIVENISKELKSDNEALIQRAERDLFFHECQDGIIKNLHCTIKQLKQNVRALQNVNKVAMGNLEDTTQTITQLKQQIKDMNAKRSYKNQKLKILEQKLHKYESENIHLHMKLISNQKQLDEMLNNADIKLESVAGKECEEGATCIDCALPRLNAANQSENADVVTLTSLDQKIEPLTAQQLKLQQRFNIDTESVCIAAQQDLVLPSEVNTALQAGDDQQQIDLPKIELESESTKLQQCDKPSEELEGKVRLQEKRLLSLNTQNLNHRKSIAQLNTTITELKLNINEFQTTVKSKGYETRTLFGLLNATQSENLQLKHKLQMMEEYQERCDNYCKALEKQLKPLKETL